MQPVQRPGPRGQEAQRDAGVLGRVGLHVVVDRRARPEAEPLRLGHRVRRRPDALPDRLLQLAERRLRPGVHGDEPPARAGLAAHPPPGQVELITGAVRAADVDADRAVGRVPFPLAHVGGTRRGAGVEAKAVVVGHRGGQLGQPDRDRLGRLRDRCRTALSRTALSRGVLDHRVVLPGHRLLGGGQHGGRIVASLAGHGLALGRVEQRGVGQHQLRRGQAGLGQHRVDHVRVGVERGGDGNPRRGRGDLPRDGVLGGVAGRRRRAAGDQHRLRGAEQPARARLVLPGSAQVDDVLVEPHAAIRVQRLIDDRPGPRDIERVSLVQHLLQARRHGGPAGSPACLPDRRSRRWPCHRPARRERQEQAREDQRREYSSADRGTTLARCP